MNLRNEADLALDEALKEHLKNLMKTCFTRSIAENDENACRALVEGLKKTGMAYFAAQKALDEL